MSELPKPRNKAKAETRLENRNGQKLVVKDYSARSVFAKLYGRMTLRNEARIYAHLSGLEGIPGCRGLQGPDALVLEHIDSLALNRIRRGTVPESVFDKIDALLESVHARGVAVFDLHGSNILLTDDERVYMIDFAHAMIARNPQRPDFLVRWFMQLDRYAAARMRARHLKREEPPAEGVFGVVYRGVKFLKKMLRRVKKKVR